MITKLYADNRCITEYEDNQKHSYNCPNCGAPINSYICEYCGTEVKHHEPVKNLDNLRRRKRQAELKATQDFQYQYLLNAFNRYNVNAQIMNIQDGIKASMAYQTCSLHDQMYNASMMTNVYPTGRIEHIPINKNSDDKTIVKEELDISISKADEEFVSAIFVFMIGMILFTVFAIVVTIIYNLY